MKTPAEVAANYVGIGKAKANLSVGKLFLLAVMAGAFIALAGAAATLGNVYANKIMGAAIFPAGLAMVLIAGSELFTGNCLLVIPLLEKEITLWQMLRNLVTVYLGNLVGSLLVSACVVWGGTFDAVGGAVLSTAVLKAMLPFGAGFLRGVLCNVLVCVAVWMAFASGATVGKIMGLYFPVFVFVICGYEHSIANMFYIPAGMMVAARLGLDASELTATGVLNNMVSVTLGNIVGGVAVGVVYWTVYLRKK